MGSYECPIIYLLIAGAFASIRLVMASENEEAATYLCVRPVCEPDWKKERLMASQGQNNTQNQGSQATAGQRADGGKQASAGIDPNSAFPGNASGVTQQDTTGAARADNTGQGEGEASVNMTDIIDKAKNKTADDLPSPQGGQADEEADRIQRATGHMSTGNVPHGGDDPQHRTNTPMTPTPNETGGKGNVGDIPMKDDNPEK
jgi:putative hemolysin